MKDKHANSENWYITSFLILIEQTEDWIGIRSWAKFLGSQFKKLLPLKKA